MHLRFLLPLSTLVCCFPMAGEVSLPALFSDHMVMRNTAEAPVWGKADPGEHVTVQLGDATAQTDAAADGRWMVRLNLENQSAGPFHMLVKGKNQIAVQDVLVGTVWLASGQSNMEHALKATMDSGKEIEHSADTQLRQFKVDKVAKPQPADDCKGHWVVARLRLSSATVR